MKYILLLSVVLSLLSCSGNWSPTAVSTDNVVMSEEAGGQALAKTGGTSITVVAYDRSKNQIYVKAYHDNMKAPHGHLYLYELYGKVSLSDAEKMANNYDPYGPQKQTMRDGKAIKQLKNLHIYMGLTDTKAKVYCVRFYESRSGTGETYQCVNATELNRILSKFIKRIFGSTFLEELLSSAMAFRYAWYLVILNPCNFFNVCSSIDQKSL